MKRLLWLCWALISLGTSVEAGTLVRIRTVYGDAVLELYDAEKPITVQNFLRYVDAGLYKNAFFHRGVSNFVMQGGGFSVTNRGTANATVQDVPTFNPIVNEFKVGPFLSNVRGTIAMAKTSDPNSATSQFFINTADNATSLDNTNNSGGFTVFGRVVSGLPILDIWRTFRKYSSTLANPTNVIGNACDVLNPTCVFAELPLTRVVAGVSLFDELIYTEITRVPPIPELELKAGTSRTLEWLSTVNVIYTIEFANSLPPAWLTLGQKLGTGALVNFADPNTAQQRYYRLRIEP